MATDQSTARGESADAQGLEDTPNWPDESAENAFLAEQKSAGIGMSPPSVPAAPRADDEAREDAATPLPTLDELIERVPAEVREVLEDLFRARFVKVVRTHKHVLK